MHSPPPSSLNPKPRILSTLNPKQAHPEALSANVILRYPTKVFRFDFRQMLTHHNHDTSPVEGLGLS